MPFKRSVAWVDVGGRTRQTILHSTAGAPLTQGAIKALSNADVLDEFEGVDNPNVAPAPNPGTYAAVALYGDLFYQDAFANIARVTIPAPKAAIFLADGVTVDPAAIAALTAAVTAELITQAGNPVTTFLAGILRGKRPDA